MGASTVMTFSAATMEELFAELACVTWTHIRILHSKKLGWRAIVISKNATAPKA